MDKIKLPVAFVEQMKAFIPNEWDEFHSALSESPEVSIRLNDKVETELSYNKVPWCSDAYYLEERPSFTLDPLFHAGTYYVQEASSMFLYQTLKQYVEPSSLVLDMCAAPGGKSTLISQYLSEEGFLISNEFVPQRAHILTENMIKWGNPNIVVTNNAPSHYECFPQMFDAVLVDAPCSGEGMFRKDERAISEWSLSNVEKCVERQRTILSSAVEILRTEGILIYSTCTYNAQENESNVRWLIENYDMELCPIELDPHWNVIKTEQGYRFMPHRTKGEGLFIAVLKKTDSAGRAYKYKKGKMKFEKDNALLKWLKTPNDYDTIIHKETIYAVRKERYDLVLDILERLNVFTFAVPLAIVKGNKHIPHAALALSKAINTEAFTICEVDYATSLSFLKTEALSLPNAPLGFVLITYKNVPLGWVKNVGNRCNNMYPSNWRIRMDVKALTSQISVLD